MSKRTVVSLEGTLGHDLVMRIGEPVVRRALYLLPPEAAHKSAIRLIRVADFVMRAINLCSWPAALIGLFAGAVALLALLPVAAVAHGIASLLRWLRG